MVRFFILIKRKGTKRFLGAIPARAGITLSRLNASARKQIKKGFVFAIITEAQLRKKFSKLIKRPVRQKKRSVNRRVRGKSKKGLRVAKKRSKHR